MTVIYTLFVIRLLSNKFIVVLSIGMLTSVFSPKAPNNFSLQQDQLCLENNREQSIKQTFRNSVHRQNLQRYLFID